MSRTLLLVGTRKGLFMLESDADRRKWSMRGPYCEGWPVYHAVFDQDSGAIYAAAASEWHGSSIWRSPDLGETWTQSSEGLAYEDGREMSKVSSVSAAHGRVLVGVEAPGIFESRDDGATWSPYSMLEGQPGSEGWDDPANQPPGHLGISAITSDENDPNHVWAIVQGISLFETTDDGKTWTPRNRGLRADWPREHEEVGFCVHKVVWSRADQQRMYQQNHVGMHRSDDAGATWTEITEGLPTEFGFAAAAHPHDRDTFHVIPLDPGHGRTMPDGQGGGLADEGRGLELGAPRERPAAGERAPRRLAPRNGGRHVRHARLLLRHEHRPGVRERGRRRELERDRELPAGDLVGRGRDPRLMADVHLPTTLMPLFAGLPRRLDLEAATVDDAIGRLDAQWPGLRDRLCEPGRRRSGSTSTSTSTVSGRGSTHRSSPARGST